MGEDTEGKIILHSQVYGEIQVEPDQVYIFENGIVGLEHLNKFALMPVEDTELFSLHAFDDEFGLFLFPAILCSNHIEFELDQQTVNSLQIEKVDELVIYYILRMIDDRPYINQKAPIIVSQKTKKGCQFIIQNDSISVREPLVIKGE